MGQPDVKNSFCTKKHWVGYMAPRIIENLIVSASILPNVNYIGSSKQWLFITPRDKRTSSKLIYQETR